MPTLHGVIASPFVRKVRVVCAEKGITYDHEPVMPMATPPEFRKISPLGKIPAWTDGDKVLADSSVIAAYLERVKPEPALYPKDPYAYARALWFEEYGDGGLAGTMGQVFFKTIVGPRFMGQPKDDAGIAQLVNETIPPQFDYLESQVGTVGFGGPSLTIGDIGVATHFVNFQHAGQGVDPARWPKLAKFLAATLERPSFKNCIAEERALFGG